MYERLSIQFLKEQGNNGKGVNIFDSIKRNEIIK